MLETAHSRILWLGSRCEGEKQKPALGKNTTKQNSDAKGNQRRKLKLFPQLYHKGERTVSPVLILTAIDQSHRSYQYQIDWDTTHHLEADQSLEPVHCQHEASYWFLAS